MRHRRINLVPTSLSLLTALAGATSCDAPGDDTVTDPIEAELDARLEVEADGPAPASFAAHGSVGESVEVDEHGGISLREPEPARSSFVESAELEARRAETDASVGTPRRGATERTLADLAARPASEPVRLLVSVDAPRFDFKRLRGAPATSRSSLISTRRDEVAAAQLPVESELVDLGARIVGRRWISTHLVVETTAGDAASVARIPGVTKVVEDAATRQDAWYDGQDIRREMLVDSLEDNGYDSLQGSHDVGRIEIAIIEANAAGGNWPDPDHVGWRTMPTSTWSRLRAVEACNAFGCTASNQTGGNTHGSAVMWAAGGDLTDGQDPDWTTVAGRERRSGVAVEAELFYYTDGGSCAGIESALEEAVDEDVDIINMSLSIPNGECDASFDCMTDAVQAAHDSGALVVASAGNDGYTGACTVEYPALLPHVLAVGGTQSNDNVAYDDQGLMDRWVGNNHLWTATGPVGITLAGGGARNTAGVDIIAPGIYRRSFTTADNYNAGTWTGTSMAAPIMAGVAGNMRDMFDSIGWGSGGSDASSLMVNLLLLGDNWDWNTDDDLRTGISDTTGFGRAKVHFPTSASLTGPWGWGWRAEHLDEGETKSWTVGGAGAESYAVEEFKWAVTWFDEDLENASDVVIRLYNTCAPGGTTQWVASDASFNLRKSIHLLGDEIGGRCLEMRATAYDTPPGGVVIWSADYWHSGDPEDH